MRPRWGLVVVIGLAQLAVRTRAQYSSLHIPYAINFEEEVLQTPSKMYIYEKFFETLSYAAQDEEFDNSDGMPIEFMLMLQRISYDFVAVSSPSSFNSAPEI